MKTIRVKLPDEQINWLKNLSKERKTSVSKLVQTAVEEVIMPPVSERPEDENDVLTTEEVEETLAALEECFGLWADREDVPDEETYVRRLRQGTSERMKRLGLWQN